MEEFKLECELRRLTPRTIKGYYNSTLLFLTWLERQQEIKELEAIRPQHIKQYIQYLIRKQLTPSYINSILRCIRAYFRYAVEEEYLTANPATKISWQKQGKVIIETFAGKDHLAIPGVLVRNHGVFAWGRDAHESVHNAVVMEEISKMNYRALTLNPSAATVRQYILDKHYLRKHGEGAYYGQ